MKHRLSIYIDLGLSDLGDLLVLITAYADDLTPGYPNPISPSSFERDFRLGVLVSADQLIEIQRWCALQAEASRNFQPRLYVSKYMLEKNRSSSFSLNPWVTPGIFLEDPPRERRGTKLISGFRIFEEDDQLIPLPEYEARSLWQLFQGLEAKTRGLETREEKYVAILETLGENGVSFDLGSLA